MADGRRRRRLKQPHEISNLSYGHFGTPIYKEKKRAWHFQRNIQNRAIEDGDDGDKLDAPPLQLLYYRINALNEIGIGNPALGGRVGRHTPKRSRKWFPELTAAATIITDLQDENTSDRLSQNESLVSKRMIIARAPYANIRNLHTEGSEVPLAASVAGEDHAALVLSPIQLQEVNGSVETDIEVPGELPLLSTNTIWTAPLNEPILQLCYMSKNSMIAYRQSSASTLCIPFIDDRSADSGLRQHVILKPILSLPTDRTGGHAHADITMTSATGLRAGVVDTHGNWSVWEVSGKRSLSTRLLYQARLVVSGKLWSWTEENRPPKGSNPYFDGWHRICFLVAEDGGRVVLVTNRHSATLYDTEGQELENVNMRLQSLSDWILDVCISTLYPSICIVLTMSRVLLLQVGINGGSAPLVQLICSCSHFLGGGDLSLQMSVLELPNGLFSACFNYCFC